MYSHWCWFQKQQTDHKVLHMKQGKLPKKMGFQTLSLAVTASFVIFITISLKWDQKVPLSSFYAGYKQYKLPSTFILGNKIEKKPKVLLSLFFHEKLLVNQEMIIFFFIQTGRWWWRWWDEYGYWWWWYRWLWCGARFSPKQEKGTFLQI